MSDEPAYLTIVMDKIDLMIQRQTQIVEEVLKPQSEILVTQEKALSRMEKRLNELEQAMEMI